MMKKSFSLRLVAWLIVAAVMVALLLYAFREQPVSVDLSRSERGTIEIALTHEGKTRVRDPYVISAPVTGRVQRINLEVGDPVVGGKTVLAILQSVRAQPLDARQRAEAEARVEEAQAALQQAQAMQRSAESELQFAETEKQRAEQLLADGAFSEGQRDALVTRAATAADSLDAATSGVRRTEYALQAARAILIDDSDQSAAPESMIEVLAPIDGMVLQRFQQSESTVAAGTPLLEIGSLHNMEIVADFLSTDAVRIQAGHRASLERWGGTEPIAAVVRRIEPAGFLKISALGVEEQRVLVVLDFESPVQASTLGHEFRVEVRVLVDQRDDVIRVPSSSLFRTSNGWALFSVESDRAKQVEVKLGVRNPDYAEIKSGLKEGLRVISHPPNTIKDGTLIRVQ
jgi:HlyD family secretion protein